jgi:ubiquinone biosynthesis protein COQ9
MSTDLDTLRDKVLLALLPDVPFDGWTRAALKRAGEKAGVDTAQLTTLFPRGPRDVAAWFSDWADREMAAALKDQSLATLKVRERIALSVRTRLDILLPHREALRRALALFALPMNLPLGAKLLYGTVDTIWRAAGDRSTDFNFYTKRGLLAGVYAATTLYWLDDRSDETQATSDFLQRRLDEVLAIPTLKTRLDRLSNPLRALRNRFSAAG